MERDRDDGWIAHDGGKLGLAPAFAARNVAPRLPAEARPPA